MAATTTTTAAPLTIPTPPLQTQPAPGMRAASTAAAEVVHRVLGTSLPLSQITQVRMHVCGTCKMGISFWPRFRFKAPADREAQPGSVKLINEADAAAHTPPAATPAAAATTGAGGPPSANTTTTSNNSPASPSQQQQDQQQASKSQQQPAAGTASGGGGGRGLLLISFTQDPPDEFSLGANFLGGIPFPFITIRTNKLEGTLDPETGAMTLQFDASFITQVGQRDRPTSLSINATLTTEPAHAFKRSMQGKRLAEGQAVLVSAAEVPKTPNWFANFILWLPTAATAKLPVRFEFS